MTAKKVTIRDVAKLAGISPSTVSNYLNATANIAPKTARNIEESIKTLNYRPNMAARNLRKNENRTIDVLIPNINNHFYSKILGIFMDLAYASGYSVYSYGYEYSSMREQKAIHEITSNSPAAVVVFNGVDDDAHLNRLQEMGIKVIFADRKTDNKKINYVAFDNNQIFREVFSLLKQSGYKNVGFFAEPPYLSNMRERYANLENAAKEAGFSFSKKNIFSRPDLCLDNLKNGYHFMCDILKKNSPDKLPDAWITSSDYLAIAVLRALEDNGYSIPGDFGIIGFDNIDITGYTHPRLTTVEQDQSLMGKVLWETVSNAISGSPEVKHIVLPQSLIIRQSC